MAGSSSEINNFIFVVFRTPVRTTADNDFRIKRDEKMIILSFEGGL